MFDEFCETLKTELVYRRVSSGDRHHKPWWNDCLATLRKNARTALKRWEMNKQNLSLKDLFLKAQKIFDMEVRKTKRAYHRHLHDKFLSNYRTRPKDFWRQIDKLGIHQGRQKKGLPNKLKDLNGEIVHNPDDVLHIWKSYFHSLFQGSNIPQENLTLPDVKCGLYDCSYLSDEIALLEVKQALNHMNSNKAPGVDEIKASFLKNEICLKFLHTFYNSCLRIGKIPMQWLKSIIKPIPKPGGDPLNPSDYRGISLQSVIMKVFCSILNARLGEYLEDNQTGRRTKWIS